MSYQASVKELQDLQENLSSIEDKMELKLPSEPSKVPEIKLAVVVLAEIYGLQKGLSIAEEVDDDFKRYYQPFVEGLMNFFNKNFADSSALRKSISNITDHLDLRDKEMMNELKNLEEISYFNLRGSFKQRKSKIKSVKKELMSMKSFRQLLLDLLVTLDNNVKTIKSSAEEIIESNDICQSLIKDFNERLSISEEKWLNVSENFNLPKKLDFTLIGNYLNDYYDILEKRKKFWS